ncbi:unnamed protein product, partial [Closterium sp. Naga37s-1]
MAFAPTFHLPVSASLLAPSRTSPPRAAIPGASYRRCSPAIRRSSVSRSPPVASYAAKSVFATGGDAALPMVVRRGAAGATRHSAVAAAGDAASLPEALLFDCDGVLVDTERDGHRVSFNQAFEEVRGSVRGRDACADCDYGEVAGENGSGVIRVLCVTAWLTRFGTATACRSARRLRRWGGLHGRRGVGRYALDSMRGDSGSDAETAERVDRENDTADRDDTPDRDDMADRDETLDRDDMADRDDTADREDDTSDTEDDTSDREDDTPVAERDDTGGDVPLWLGVTWDVPLYGQLIKIALTNDPSPHSLSPIPCCCALPHSHLVAERKGLAVAWDVPLYGELLNVAPTNAPSPQSLSPLPCCCAVLHSPPVAERAGSDVAKL